MIQRLPLAINGRDVHLHRMVLPEKYRSLTQAVWDDIMATQGDGKWYSMVPTAEMDSVAGKRLEDAIKHRSYIHGYTSDVLSIRMTKVNGMCWHWKYVNDKRRAKIEERRQEEIAKRRAKRNSQQKKWRAENKIKK